MNRLLTSLVDRPLDMRLKYSCLIIHWEKVYKLVSIYEALYTVLHIVDSEVIPTMPFVYELIWGNEAKFTSTQCQILGQNNHRRLLG